MIDNVLVIYDMFGDVEMEFYLISKEKHPEIFNDALNSDGIIINVNNQDGDAGEKLQDFLNSNGESCLFDKNILIPANTKLVHFGFAC
jgi:hypothetical protein